MNKTLKRLSFIFILAITLFAGNINFAAKSNVEVTNEKANVTKVDLTGSSVDSNGRFNLKVKVYGSNLNEMTSAFLYTDSPVGGTTPRLKVELNSGDTMRSGSAIWNGSSLIQGESYVMQFRYYNVGDAAPVAAPSTISSTAINSKVQIDNYSYSINAPANGSVVLKKQLDVKRANVTKVDLTGSNVDSSGVFNLKVKVYGTNLDKMTAGYLYTDSPVGGTTPRIKVDLNSGDTMRTGTAVWNGPSLVKNEDYNLQYRYYNAGDAAPVAAPSTISSTAINNKVQIGNYSYSIKALANNIVTLKKSEDTTTPIVNKVDLTGSNVDSTGMFNMKVKVYGTNLDKMTSGFLYTESPISGTNPRYKVALNSGTTLRTGTVSIKGASFVENLNYVMQFRYYKAGQSTPTIAPTTISSTAINNKVQIDNYSYSINASANGKVTLRKSIDTSTPKVTKVDLAGSTVDSTGTFNMKVKVYGTNLDKMTSGFLYTESPISGTNPRYKVALNSGTTTRTGTVSIKGTSFIVNQAYTMQFRYYKAGQSTPTVAPSTITTVAINKAITSGTKKYTINGAANGKVTLKVVEVVIPDPKFTSVDGKGSHVDSSGNFVFNVLVKGTNLDQIDKSYLAIKSSGKQYNLNLSAGTTSRDGSLVIPRTDVNVDSSESVEFKYTIKGKTTVVNYGDLKSSQAIDSKTQAAIDDVAYLDWMTAAANNVITFGKSSDTSSLEVTDPQNIVFLVLNESVSPEDLLYRAGSTVINSDAGEDTRFEASPAIDTSHKISIDSPASTNITVSDKDESKTVTVQYYVDDSSVNPDDFICYSNNESAPSFSGNLNELELIDYSLAFPIDYEDNVNRGCYTKKQIDTSKSIHISGQYNTDESVVGQAGEGMSFTFHDGSQTSVGGTKQAMGIINDDGSAYAKHGIAAAIDTGDDFPTAGNLTDSIEIDTLDATNDYDDTNGPLPSTIANADATGSGRYHGLITFGHYLPFDIRWTPESDTTSKYSGTLEFRVTTSVSTTKVLHLKEQIPKEKFPQGKYWFKLSGVTGNVWSGLVRTGDQSLRLTQFEATQV